MLFHCYDLVQECSELFRTSLQCLSAAFRVPLSSFAVAVTTSSDSNSTTNFSIIQHLPSEGQNFADLPFEMVQESSAMIGSHGLRRRFGPR
jgi:hypothetical protein